MTDSKRLIDLLSATDEFFKARGIESPRRNAEALFAKALSLPRIELYLQHDRPLKDFELDQIRDLIRRRAKREPLQYLVGEVEFCSVRLELTPGLLIPRPETEEMVYELIKLVPRNSRILDIGSGSGCISVSLAKNCPTSSVTAVDIDNDAVDQSIFNAGKNGVQDRVTGLAANLFQSDFATQCGAPFDVVVSNPPYIREAEWESLQTEVKDYERKHALISGSEGDECYVRIAQLLPDLLMSGGVIALEFGYNQASRIQGLFSPLLSNLVIHRDMQGFERFLIGKR